MRRPSSTTDLSTILRDDLERLMPVCDVLVERVPAGGYVSTAVHRVTSRALRLHVGPTIRATEGEWVLTGAGSTHSGTTAYGFDSAVTFHYRQYLDYTTEHGPGTAWDYAQHDAYLARHFA